jgi:hypothetical protein
MTSPMAFDAFDHGEDHDDPLALPFPSDTLLLDDWPPAGDWSQPAPVAQALQALRQQFQELGLRLDLVDGVPAPVAADSHRVVVLEGFRVQVVCAPFWADGLAIPSGPWSDPGHCPHLLLGAWVDGPAGAIRLPGVLTAREVVEALPGLEGARANGEEVQQLDVAALRGGLERLFTLVRLLQPESLALSPAVGPTVSLPLPQASAQTLSSPSGLASGLARPQPAPASENQQPAWVALITWLQGQLGEALAPFAPEWVPAEAAAFRSAVAAPGMGVLAAVAIPLGLVAGQVCWGGQRRATSERFQLLLSLCGSPGRAERLEVRLEPSLQGDLLPQNLSLVVGEQVLETGPDGNLGPLVLTVPAGDQLIEIRLERQGVTELQLPPMILASPVTPS